MLDVGSLRKRVVLQRRSIVQDPSGGQVEEWTEIGRVWAAIRGLTTRERLAANAVRAEDTHELTLRYFAGLSPKDRVSYLDDQGAEHLYNITAVNDDQELHHYLTCLATEGLSPG